MDDTRNSRSHKLRSEDYNQYKQIKNEVTSKCREAKEKWLKENIEEIEIHLAKNNTDKAYNTVKKLHQKHKTTSNIVKDKEGKILFENEKVAKRWKEYMEDLYEGDEITNKEDYIENEIDVEDDSKGPEIMRSEFDKALKELTEKKAAGIDDIPAELLKNMGEEYEEKLYKIIKECYNTGTLPPDFIKSKTITLPKKGNATECGNYRTIALLSHASKILLNIIKNRLKDKVDRHLSEDQFGFRKGRGTREAILALRQILERRLDVNKATFTTFIDLEKAFDKIDWKLLFTTLKNKGVDWRDRRIIFNLYKTQTTQIDVNGVMEEAKIRKSVRTGLPLVALYVQFIHRNE